MSKTTIPLPNYEGVSVEFDDTKISKEFKEKFIENIQSKAFKNHQFIMKNSYFVGEFEVFTVPLEKDGYSVKDEKLGQMIFVCSKLPKAERANVIRELIQKRRAKEAENF